MYEGRDSAAHLGAGSLVSRSLRGGPWLCRGGRSGFQEGEVDWVSWHVSLTGSKSTGLYLCIGR